MRPSRLDEGLTGDHRIGSSQKGRHQTDLERGQGHPILTQTQDAVGPEVWRNAGQLVRDRSPSQGFEAGFDIDRRSRDSYPILDEGEVNRRRSGLDKQQMRLLRGQHRGSLLLFARPTDASDVHVTTLSESCFKRVSPM
jgi:hypothetical protein